MNLDLAARRREYDEHVWDHTADVFQTQFDLRRPLGVDELEALNLVADAINAGADDAALAKLLGSVLGDDPELLFSVMQQAGLTRNKIIVDLKAASSSEGIRVPASPHGLLQSRAAWGVAGPYLAFRLRKTLEPIAALTSDVRAAAFEAINQATYPHWIRQERAKRQGHQAEYRVAVLLFSLGIPFSPFQKVENPLCRDEQIGGVSFDIVVRSRLRPVLVLKSTVQTANIGQFGESKAGLEVDEALAMLTANFTPPRPTLVAMIDGVGFKSNIAGLNNVLTKADEFAQFATIWKVAVIAGSRLGRPLHLALPDVGEHSDFLGEWSTENLLIEDLNEDFRSRHDPADLVPAGEGVFLNS